MDKQEREKAQKEWKLIEDKLINMVADTNNQAMMDTLLDWLNIRNKLNQGFVDFLDENINKRPYVNLKEVELAAEFLNIAQDTFKNHGCNDVDADVWEGWTKEERQKFVKEYHDYNRSPKEYHPNNLDLPDWAIMDFLAVKLQLHANQINEK